MKIRFVLLAGVLACFPALAQDVPKPIQALSSKGFTVQAEMSAPPGYRGFVAKYRGRPVPLYLLPDDKHVSLGNLFDAEGNDLTQQAMQDAITPKLDGSTWKELSKSAWVAEGAIDPQRIVYVFTDTECPFCHQLWQATQRYVRQGNVQVRNIMVAVIAPVSAGRAAAVLGAPNPTAALAAHEADPRNSKLQPLRKMPRGLADKIATNNALMNSLGIFGTPGIVFRDGSGKVRIAQGMQSDEALAEIFGGQARSP